MWFDKEEKNTCIDCKYGNKEIYTKHCDQCISVYCMTGSPYTEWKGSEKENDLSILRYARLREIITYCQCHILGVKTWFTCNIKFRNQHRKNKTHERRIS